jgi:glycerol-3-phosphate dehydrogenase (NAD(P)+)
LVTIEQSVSILGLGNWGTALGQHLCAKGHKVIGWSVEAGVVQSVNKDHRNPMALPNIDLHPYLSATSNLAECLSADFIVLAFASSAIDTLVGKLKAKTESIFVSAIKGLEEDSLMTPLQYCEAHLPQKNRLAVLSGPSFAKDIIAHRPSGVVAASKDEATAKIVADLFNSDWMKVYVSTDPIGVELGGALKNIVALAAGVCDGLQLGDSARAGLITRGLAEITRLAVAMGADHRTLAGLSGLGDLVMTSSSNLSRNRTVGLRLASGEKLADIIKNLGSVAEGVSTTPLALSLAKRHGVEMPITSQVAKLLRGEISPAATVKELLSRPMKAEF